MKNKTNLIFLPLLLLSCGEAKVNPCFFIYDLNDNFMSSLKDEFSLALKEKDMKSLHIMLQGNKAPKIPR